MSLEQARKCVDHQNQDIIFMCLFGDCLNTRLGCQKCLLSKHSKCIRGCIFLNDLTEETFAWSGEASDLAIEQFILTKATGVKEIDKNIDDLITLVLRLTKEAKKDVMKKRIQSKSEIQKQAKTHINQYSQSFSVEGLKDVVLEFHKDKISEKEATQKITSLSKQRADLEDQNHKGKILSILPSLQKDDIKTKEREIIIELSGLQNIFSFSQGWEFMKSHLAKETHCFQGITETLAGTDYSFNENDKWQLIYGTQRWKEGTHQWEVTVNLIDEEKKQDEKKEKEEEEEGLIKGGLESIMQTNLFGAIVAPANSGMYAGAEYNVLNRLYFGVVADARKDSQANYIIGSTGCEGLDVIRGQLLGNMYMSGASQAVNNVFKTKKKDGLTFTCKLNIESKHFMVSEKEGLTSYESTFYQQVAEWRPFILSVKSKVKVKLVV